MASHLSKSVSTVLLRMNVRSPGLVSALFMCVASMACEPAEVVTESEVEATLLAFLGAFENGDYEAMQSFFDSSATSFPSTMSAPGFDGEINPDDFKRVEGLPPGMARVVDSFRDSAAEPPYIRLEPQDLRIQIYGPAAVATLHFGRTRDDGTSDLGRRTFVLVKRPDKSLKIVHLHPSNVRTSWPPDP